MSIDEAIAQEKANAEKLRKDNENCKYKSEYGCKGCADYYSKPCIECAEEHEQIAEWLEELKEIKSNGRYVQGNKAGQKIGYRNAIDDFVKEICKMIVQSENNGNYRFYAVEIKQAIVEIAEQLKEGGQND